MPYSLSVQQAKLFYLGLCKYTFSQRRDRLTTHFSERIPVVKRHVSVHRAESQCAKGGHSFFRIRGSGCESWCGDREFSFFFPPHFLQTNDGILLQTERRLILSKHSCHTDHPSLPYHVVACFSVINQLIRKIKVVFIDLTNPNNRKFPAALFCISLHKTGPDCTPLHRTVQRDLMATRVRPLVTSE